MTIDNDEWIEDLPDSHASKNLLISIKNMHPGSINEPRHVIFDIVGIQSKGDATRLAEELEKDGWICEIDPDGMGSPYLVEISNLKYVFSKRQLESDVRFFIDLAMEYGGVYSGWSVIFPIPE